MSDDRRWLRTEEDVERFYRARRRGGECAACGRDLAKDEPIFIERFQDVRGQRTNRMQGPVGFECASTELRLAVLGRTPEQCAGCSRPVYYGVDSKRRRQALCSQDCRNRAAMRRRGGG